MSKPSTGTASSTSPRVTPRPNWRRCWHQCGGALNRLKRRTSVFAKRGQMILPQLLEHPECGGTWPTLRERYFANSQILLDLSATMLKKLLVLVLMFAGTCPAALAGPDQWTEVSSSHFVVVTNASEKQARHILDQFERMRWVFQTLFPKLNVDP